ncbi:MAG: hypothetical protein SNJ81_13910, partial [Cyanobacteriota bacterium]
MLVYQNPTIVQNPLGVPEGLTLSRSAAQQITIAPGRAVVARSSGIRQIATRTTTLAKNLNATWAQGNNQGGRASTVALTASTVYHVYLLMDSGGNVDAYFDTSATAANRPAGWDARMVGSILTDGSNNIREFNQIDNRFEYHGTEVIALWSTNLSTASGNVITLPTPSFASAFGTCYGLASTGTAVIWLGAESDPSPNVGLFASAQSNDFFWQVNTNRMRIYTTQANVTAIVRVRGFARA